jgi:hypothetical protein
MNTLAPTTENIPTTFELISSTPGQAIAILKTLHDQVMNLLDRIPTRTDSARKYLSSVILPYTGSLDFRRIYLGVPADLQPPPSRPLTLHETLTSLSFFNTLPATYDEKFEAFINLEDHQPAVLPVEGQTAIRSALKRLTGIQYYLDDFTQFWRSKHIHSELTNADYLARVFSAQLQCTTVLRTADHSLPLHTITLPCLLSLRSTTYCQLYRLSITNEALDIRIPMNGVFIVAQSAEDRDGETNFCTLYGPGCTVMSFHKLASLKTYLINALKSDDSEENWRACIDGQNLMFFSLRVSNTLEDHSLSLTPTPTGDHFYQEHIQIIIDKHKRDILNEWTRAIKNNTIHIKRIANYIIGDANAQLPHSLTFTRTLKKYTPLEMTLNCPPSAPPEAPEAQPIDLSLTPIKINVVVHQDLVSTLPAHSLYETHFSWLAVELENISRRKVLVTIINDETTQRLATYEYRSQSAIDATNGWAALIHATFPESRLNSPLAVYVLLTTSDFIDGVSGFASSEDRVAIARGTYAKIVGHEIGHLFEANHAHGGVIYSSCWSRTLMDGNAPPLLNAVDGYRFSTRNRENIRLYLSQFD